MNVMDYRSDTSIVHAMNVDVPSWLIDPFEFTGEILIFLARSTPEGISLIRIIFGPLSDLPLILGGIIGVITKTVESGLTEGGSAPFPLVEFGGTAFCSEIMK